MKEETKCYCGHTTYCDCGPETLYDAFLNCLINKEFKTKEDYIAFRGAEFGAKWQAKRSYSEEEVMDILLLSYSSISDKSLAGADLRKWFDQFKKK